MSTRFVTVTLALATPLLVACGGDEEPSADCIDATDMGPTIAQNVKGPEITPENVQAVQSDASDVYYVAMDFTVDGDEESGVWAVTGLDPDATSILAVDAMAKTVTGWPDAAETYDITYPNDGTDAAESCL